eukprot:7521752-Alexandrium_andersonii.AAC.1
MGRQRGRIAPVQSRAALCIRTHPAPRALALACRQQARAAARRDQSWASINHTMFMDSSAFT